MPQKIFGTPSIFRSIHQGPTAVLHHILAKAIYDFTAGFLTHVELCTHCRRFATLVRDIPMVGHGIVRWVARATLEAHLELSEALSS